MVLCGVMAVVGEQGREPAQFLGKSIVRDHLQKQKYENCFFQRYKDTVFLSKKLSDRSTGIMG